MSGAPDLTALRQRAAALDASDPLAVHADQFDLPRGSIYLDGNSLGPPPRGVMDRLTRVASQEWGVDLISSWNKNGWMDLSAGIGAKIGRLIGAPGSAVRACDSTSVNLLKVLSAALSLRPDRKAIVSERGNFPTDLYVAQRLIAGLGKGHELRLIDDAETDLDKVLDGDVATVMLTQVDYRTGRKLDMASMTARAHDAGALTVWDLAHSAGAFAVDLTGAGADFAVGCGYKFLNGGPGAPAFLYVAPGHQEAAEPVLAGWIGHAAPFDFLPDYAPAAGIDRYLIGTPPVLSMSALDAALEVLNGVEGDALEKKSSSLSGLFIDAVAAACGEAAPMLASPAEASRRGAQASFRHEEGYAIVQALIARGITGDFRAPDIMRFGFSPLYLTHMAVVDAAETLATVLRTSAWDRPEYKTRAAVT